MLHKFKVKIIGIIILYLLIVANIIFQNDELAIITGAILLVIILVLCQASVIKEKRLESIRLISSSDKKCCRKCCVGNERNKDIECMCDECEHYFSVLRYKDKPLVINFCPYCGVKMEDISKKI